MKPFFAFCLVAWAVFSAGVPAWAQPNTPAYAAKMAYEAAHSFDADTLLQYACIEGEERMNIRQFFADQVHKLEQVYGLDWNQVTIDFSQVRYEVLEQTPDQARVRISGPYVINYLGEKEVDEDPDVIIVQMVDGQWLMCGDQDLAQQPLMDQSVSLDPYGPVYAAKMSYEAAHSLDADGFGQWSCVDTATLADLKAEFEKQQNIAARAVGVQWSQVHIDFSRLTYELLEQVDDRARVRVQGSYVITYPGGREVDDDPDVVLVQLVNGQWLMCGDQDQANMPLSPYSSNN